MKILKTASLSVAALALATTVSTADTLDSIKKKGSLSCGVSTGIAGFS